MSAFKTLRDISNSFEVELRRASTELFSAKVQEPFEDSVAKKLRDLSLFTSKLRLLQAKPISCTPQISEIEKNDETTINNYAETAAWKLIELQTSKVLLQTHSVKGLITTPSRNLDPELMERKEKIIEQLTKYREQESLLRELDAVLTEKRSQCDAARHRWSEELTLLRAIRASAGGSLRIDSSDPLYLKLRVLVGKMELMRWLISKLVTSRAGSYDWLSDPHMRLPVLALAREPNTVESFISS